LLANFIEIYLKNTYICAATPLNHKGTNLHA